MSGGRLFRNVIDVTRVGDWHLSGHVACTLRRRERKRRNPGSARLAGGERVRETWDGRDRIRSFAYVATSPVVAVQIDPDHLIAAETERVGNSWTARSKAAAVSLAWSGRWMLWLQDHLLSVASLI